MDTEQEEIDNEEEQIPQVITDEYLEESLRKFEELIKELRSQENYQFANKFRRLVTILENVHFQLKNEEKKCFELLEQHVDASGRIEEAMKISQRDSDLINKLKEDVKNAWNEADASKLREQHTNESLNVLREYYTSLNEKMKKMSSDVEMSDELGKHKVTVLQQCEKLVLEVDELNKRLTVQRLYSEELQKKLEDALEKNRDLFREWDLATNDSLMNKDKIDKLQTSLNDIKDDNDKITESLFHYKEISDERHNKLMQRDKQVKSLSEKLEKLKSDHSSLAVTNSKLERALKACKKRNSDFEHDIYKYQEYIQTKNKKNKQLINERENEIKKVEKLNKKISNFERIISKQEQEIDLKKNEIHTIEKEGDLIKKSNDDMKRENAKLRMKVEQLMQEIERLNAFISTLKQEKQKLEEENILINIDLKTSIEREKKSSSNVKKLQANIETVESEKQFLDESIKQLNEDIQLGKKQYENIKSELSEKNEQVAHYKHEYDLSLKRLKDARSDYQRCHEKELDIKDRLMKYKSQTDDVNVKLTAKLAEIVSMMKKIKRLEKKNRETKREFEKSQDTLRLCRMKLRNMDHENKLLKDEIRKNQSQFIKMKNQADKILRERDLIANQMYRKVDENSLLEDQVSTLKMTIERGNLQYNERLDDIKIMKNEIQSLRSQCNVLKRGLQNTTDMRQEVLQLHRKLNQERTKAKVLEEEISTPVNVHRWRKLSYRDPNRYELLKKCQKLQRDCLKNAAKLIKGEELIKALQEKISKLEVELQKRPNFEVSEKLLLTRTKLNENTKRMKAAIAISRATVSDVNLKDNVIIRMQAEMNEIKSQLFKEKRIKQKLTQKVKKLKVNSENHCNQKEVIGNLENLGNIFKLKLLS